MILKKRNLNITLKKIKKRFHFFLIFLKNQKKYLRKVKKKTVLINIKQLLIKLYKLTIYLKLFFFVSRLGVLVGKRNLF